MAVGELQRRFGLNLRKFRQSAGLSQEAFADRLRMHRTYVGGLERGERNLTLQSVERIADVLSVSPTALLDDVEDSVVDGGERRVLGWE